MSSTSRVPPAYSALVPSVVRTLLDSLIDAAVVVDPELGVHYFNRQFVALSGLSARDLQRGTHRDLCHALFDLETCADEAGCLARRAFQTRKPIRVDEVTARARGLRLIATAVPLLGEDGVPYAVVESYRDVTAESQMQESYKDLLAGERLRNEILQREVQRRTSELTASLQELTATRTRLVQSEKMSALGQLVAGVAHEVNNPTNFIYANLFFLEEYAETLLGLVDGLGELSLPEETRRALEARLTAADFASLKKDLKKLLPAVRTGTERISRIVKELTAFSHPGERDVAACNLNEEITSTLDFMRAQSESEVELSAELGDIPDVVCSGAQIMQVITNLVVNAIHATEDQDRARSVRVVTYAEGDADENTWVVVDVIDNGRGVPDEIRTKIFDPFFTTKPVGKGTGLGLYISFAIVSSHGGEIDVVSQPGRGSTFRVRLPTLGVHRPASRSTPPPPPPPGPAKERA